MNADSKLVDERKTSQQLVVHDSPPSAGGGKNLQQTLAALATEFAMLAEAQKKRRAKFERLRDESTILKAENKTLRDEMSNLLEEIDDLYDVTECCLPFIRDYNLAIRPFTLKRKRDDLEDDPVDEDDRDAKRHKAYHVCDDDDGWDDDLVSDDDVLLYDA
jgi:FtsZ-binding cell division protein ZapB